VSSQVLRSSTVQTASRDHAELQEYAQLTRHYYIISIIFIKNVMMCGQVRPQLQASSSSSSPMAQMRSAMGGVAAGMSAAAAAAHLMIPAAAGGQSYQYAALGTSPLLTQDSTGIGFQVSHCFVTVRRRRRRYFA